MSLNNSLNNSIKEAQTNNGESLLPSRCPVHDQRRPGCHQTTARKKLIKDNNKFIITCYLKAKEDAQG